MSSNTVRATITNTLNDKSEKFSFVEKDGMVHVYTKTSAYGAFLVGRFGDGRLNRKWVREFAAPCEVSF